MDDAPDIPFALVWVVMQFGNVLAIWVVTALAFIRGHRRLAASTFGGGYVAYYGAKLIKHNIIRPRPIALLSHVHIRGYAAHGSGFVAGHTAVAASLAILLAPYVGRRWRWVLSALVVVVGFTRVYVGSHLPLDVVGGAAIGVAVGALTRFAVGSSTVTA